MVEPPSQGPDTTGFDVSAKVGADPAGDTLFDAAVLVLFALQLGDSPTPLDTRDLPGRGAEPFGSSTPTAAAARPPSNEDMDAAGTPHRRSNPTRADIRDAQECHPVTRLLLKGLGASLIDRPHAFDPVLPSEGDPEYSLVQRELLHFVVEEDGVLSRKNRRLHFMSDGQIFEYGPKDVFRIVIPPKYQAWAMSCHHDRKGHLGVGKNFPGLLYQFYWGTREQMRADFSLYIGDCPACIHCKVSHHKTGAGSLVQNGEHMFDITSADYYKVGRVSRKGGPKDFEVQPGNLEKEATDGALTSNDIPEEGAFFDGTVSFGCQFSRMIKVVATKGTPTARCIARLLIEQVIRYYGTPRAVRSDHGSNFVALVLKALYRHFGIRMEASAPYHHQTVGLVERWHSVLKQLIMTHYHASGEPEWHLYLPFMEIAFNMATNTATGFSPMFIANLRHVRAPMDSLSTPLNLTKEERSLPDWVKDYLHVRGVVYDEVGKVLKLNQLHRLRKFNLQRDVVTEFYEGQRVLITKGRFVDKNLPKAEEPTEGPFVVERKLANGNYSLVLGARKLKNTFHADRLIACPVRRTIAQSELTDWYPVKGITDRRISADGTRVEYRIHWAGFEKAVYKTWLSLEYLYGIAHLVAEYNSKFPLPPGFAAESQPLVDRDDGDAPPPSDAARKVPHFKQVRSPLPPPSAAPPGPEIIPEDSVAAPPACDNCDEDPPTTSAPLPPISVGQLSEGSLVEVFLPNAVQQLGKRWTGTESNIWLPARVLRTRVLPARPPRPERPLVIVLFEGDGSRRERTFDLSSESLNPIRFPSHSNAASFQSTATTWVRCIHGAVLVHGGDQMVTYPGHSLQRCHHSTCEDGRGAWFEKFSTTSLWRTVYREGRESSLISFQK